MAAGTWYAPYREKFMTQEEQDQIRGRVTREYEELTVQVQSLSSKLKAVGVGLAKVAADLQQWPHTVNVDRPTFEKELSGLWDTLDKYSKAASEEASKKMELDRLKSRG